MIPETLDTPEFRQAWAEWLDERKAKKIKPYTERGKARLLAELAGYGPEVAVMAIDSSIAKGYQGLFPDKFAGKSRTFQRGNGAGEFSGVF